MFRLMACFSISIIVMSCAPSALTPVTVPLQYKSVAEASEIPMMQTCAAVSAVEVKDERRDPALGVRYMEDKKDMTHPVTASGDVAGWVRSGAEGMLKRAGVATGSAGKPVLHITIEQITTDESVYRRAEFDGRVILKGELRPSGGGRACWTDRGDGFAENYGYPGSAENYQETLNHALDRAVAKLLNSNGFREAVCTTCR